MRNRVDLDMANRVRRLSSFSATGIKTLISQMMEPTRRMALLLAIVIGFGAGWVGKTFIGNSAVADTREAGASKQGIRNPATPGGSGRTGVSERSPRREQRILPGHGMSPAQHLEQAYGIADPREREQYLRELISSWVRKDGLLGGDVRENMLRNLEDASFRSKAGLDVALTDYVAMLGDGEIREAWKTAHASHLSRCEIFAKLAKADLAEKSLSDLMGVATDWTEWEKSRYRNNLLRYQAIADPVKAMAWLESQPDEFSKDAIDTIYSRFADVEFDVLEDKLTDISDPQHRETAIRALADALTGNTRAALEWADSLGSASDREIAHARIHKRTPRGIGVLYSDSEGYSVVQKVIREGTGLLAGDRIVTAREAGGETVDLYGQNSAFITETLRGEPGTEVTIHVLRKSEITGKLEQVELIVTREQLYIE